MIRQLTTGLSLFLILGGLSLVSFPQVDGTALTSSYKLLGLWKRNSAAVGSIEEYIDKEQKRLDKLKRAVQVHRNITSQLDDVYHPVQAFHFIKSWSHVHKKLIPAYEYNVTNVVESLNQLRVWVPTQNEYYGALAALLRIQRTYNISTDDMKNGLIRGRTSQVKLMLKDMYALATTASDNWKSLEYIDHWFRELTAATSNAATKKQMYKTWAYQLNKENLYERAKEVFEHLVAEYPDDKNITTAMEENQRQLETMQEDDKKRYGELEEETIKRVEWLQILEYVAERLCRGDMLNETEYKELYRYAYIKHSYPFRPAVPSTQLNCYYNTASCPYCPYKEELLHKDPMVIFIYDFIHDADAKQLMDAGRDRLLPAQVCSSKECFTSKERISDTSSLSDMEEEIPHIRAISRKLSTLISDVTGLSTAVRRYASDAETTQVINYGMGGMYDVHADTNDAEGDMAPDYLQNSGNRLATFITYLTQPEEGGDTVLPMLNLRVPAVKNGAVMWYNYDTNVQFDRRTYHAGCPVLYGEKWIATKWIRSHGQMFRHPCTLHPEGLHVPTALKHLAESY